MPLKSDLQVDVAKFDDKNISDQTKKFNDGLMKIMAGGPRWYEVSDAVTNACGCFESDRSLLVGRRRKVSRDALEWRDTVRSTQDSSELKQPSDQGLDRLPKPQIVESARNSTLPSRESGRNIPIRIFEPESGTKLFLPWRNPFIPY